MAEKKILIIAEGSTEKIFINKLFELFYAGDASIFLLKTNIYRLYQYYESYKQPYSDLDLKNVLLEKVKNLTDQDKEKLLCENYSETLLIFDWDPQDPLFGAEKLKKLMTHFNDSSDYGRLYINYPMVESFRHIDRVCYETGKEDQAFEQRTFDLKDLSQYKSRVDKEGFRFTTSILKMPMKQDECNVLRQKVALVINQHFKKTAKLANVDLDDAVTQTVFNSLLETQCEKLLLCSEAFVVNTSCLIIPELYLSNFRKYLK